MQYVHCFKQSYQMLLVAKGIYEVYSGGSKHHLSWVTKQTLHNEREWWT